MPHFFCVVFSALPSVTGVRILGLSALGAVGSAPTKVSCAPTEVRCAPTIFAIAPTKVGSAPILFVNVPTKVRSEPSTFAKAPTKVGCAPTDVRSNPSKVCIFFNKSIKTINFFGQETFKICCGISAGLLILHD